MSRITIIVNDKTVSIDGLAKVLPNLVIDSDIHAVQWYENYGEIEFVSTRDGKPHNEIFEDISRFQDIIDMWESTEIQVPALPTIASGTQTINTLNT